MGEKGRAIVIGAGMAGLTAAHYLKEAGFEGVLAVEREAGDDRFSDIKLAVERLSQFGGYGPG